MVQLRPDQERVRTLIKETITLLCKNGLAFDAHFSIDALIGVTLDDKDVFLVNINELVKSEKAQAAEAQQHAEESSEGDISEEEFIAKKRPPGSPSQMRKKRKRLIKSEPGPNNESASDDNTADYSPDDTSSHQTPRLPQPNAHRTNDIKREEQIDSDDEQNNVIIIKEELEDSWQGPDSQGNQDDSSFSQFVDMPGTSQDQNFSSLADMSLMPVGPQDASQVWAQSAAYSSPGSAGRSMPHPSAVAGTQQLDPAQEVVYEFGKKRFRCSQCGVSCSTKWNLLLHTRLHSGKYPYYCPTCKKGCGSTTQLKNHMARHTGKLKFICKTCGDDFEYKKLLTEHTRITGHVDDCQFRRTREEKKL